MSELILSAAIGAVLGILAGLGVGGGSLLLLWLTLIKGIDPAQARSINLLFFLPGAAIACFLRRKQQTIPWRKILPAILGGCTAAAICALIGNHMDGGILKKLFATLLILTGIRELFYKPKNQRLE